MQSQVALGSITTNKARGGDRIPVELFQILKDDAVTVLHFAHMPAHLENSGVTTGLEKVSFHSNPKERQCQRMLKLPHNCTLLTCLLLGRKATTNLDRILKSRDITLLAKVHLVKATVFPVGMDGRELDYKES